MKEYVFEGGLKYYQYENEELFYNAITELLDKGYQIKNNIFLSVLLENNNERIILGYQDIDNHTPQYYYFKIKNCMKIKELIIGENSFIHTVRYFVLQS